MAISKTLIGNKIRLIPFSESHLTDHYINWLNDPMVVKFSEQRHVAHSKQTCRQYWESFSNSPNYFWAIETMCDNPEHIGNSNAYLDLKNGIADLGILIGHSGLWGKGYGLDAWNTAMNYLLSLPEIRKVTAGTMENNLSMLKIFSKSGMQEDGKRSKHFMYENKAIDLIHFAKFK